MLEFPIVQPCGKIVFHDGHLQLGGTSVPYATICGVSYRHSLRSYPRSMLDVGGATDVNLTCENGRRLSFTFAVSVGLIVGCDEQQRRAHYGIIGTLYQRVHPHILAALLRRLVDGQRVRIGTLDMSRGGLSIAQLFGLRRLTVPWNALLGMERVGGMAQVYATVEGKPVCVGRCAEDDVNGAIVDALVGFIRQHGVVEPRVQTAGDSADGNQKPEPDAPPENPA